MHIRLSRLIAGLVSLFAIASLHADTAPTIASVSSSQTLTEGQSITLSVSVNGTTPFTYQWRKDGNPITGATSNSYALNPALAEDDGAYTVVITNSAGSIIAGPIVLAVAPATPPSLSSSPSGTSTLTVGDNLYLSTWASGSTPMTFIWKRNGTEVARTTSNYYYSTSSSFSKNSVSLADAGVYTVTAENVAGSVTSSGLTINIVNPIGPGFTAIPSNTAATPGGSFTLYGYATGSGSISYQWYKDGVAITGATSTSYSKSNVTATDAGTYTVVATNLGGSVTSPAATVTISSASTGGTPPRISSVYTYSNPIVVGNYFTIYADVSSNDSLAYQWYKDGIAISGATSWSYGKSSATLADAGAYSVVAINTYGSATSASYGLSVSLAEGPKITQQPASQAAYQGADTTFYIATSGIGSAAYQWYKDGVAISGATYSSLSLNDVTDVDAADYHVVITSGSTVLTSNAAPLTILDATLPVFTTHPANVTLRPGETFSVSASATASPSPTYQWYFDGNPISGATSSSYSKSSIAASDAGTYTVVASTATGSTTSNAITLAVLEPEAPVITLQPSSQSVLPNSSISLSVSVKNPYGAEYQWYRDDGPIADARSSSYYISAAQPSHAGTYHVVVSNASGDTSSQDAMITVDSYTTRPLIISTPGDQDVMGGGSVTLQLGVASGATTQWYKDDVAIQWATGTSLTINNFSLGDIGVYTAEVSRDSVTVTSGDITLSMLDSGRSPVITQHPASRILSPGNSVYLSVNADGERPFSYEWRRDGVAIAGATNPSLEVYNFNGSKVGDYTVVITNRNGSATSEAATLSLPTPSTTAPVILRQPASRTLSTDAWSFELLVGLADYNYVSYQWYKDGSPISGATGTNYYKSSLSTSDSGSYTVKVTNTAGSTTSETAIVTVVPRIAAPIFATQPSSALANAGQTVVLSASAISTATTGSLSYQWKKNGVAISGATSSTLTLTNVQAANAGTYVLVASDANGATASRSAIVAMNTPTLPVFTLQPSNVHTSLSSSALFTAAATGNPSPTYQWYRNGVAISGATSASLSIYPVEVTDLGSYTVVATNSVGATTSTAATLTVNYSFTGAFFGTFSDGGNWALYVRPDHSAVFVGALASRDQAIFYDDVLVDFDGTIDFGDFDESNPLAARYYDGPITARITTNGLAGQLPDLNVTFSGNHVATPSIPVGVYEAVPLAASEAILYLAPAERGQMVFVYVRPEGVSSALGTLNSTGAFTVSLSDGTFSGTIHSETGNVTSTYTPTGGGTPLSLATPAAPDGPERLANLSTRGVAGTGENTLIAGFIVTGGAPKDLLIRAVGPTLHSLGVTGELQNPRLTLFQSGTVIAENDDWSLASNAAQIAETASRITGLPFPAGSADAALLVRLNPGAYTAHVSSVDSSTGVVMVEAYDANDAAAGAPKLINISTRGGVGTGDNILIVGIVVGGNAPKHLLIRAIGPGLLKAGVTGALADPKLVLFQGGTVIGSNDNWSAGSDAAAIAAASKTVTGTSPENGSKDAAMLLYLAPGVYTAQVSGVGGTTGVALVEAFEVP